jgi:hypothetical protein
MIITKIYLIALILICSNCAVKERQCVFVREIDGFDHSCPTKGHGDCFLCDSKEFQINKNNSKKNLTFNK